MNIKSQAPTIRSYGTPSIFSGTNLWTVKNISEDNNNPNYHWFFNGQDTELSANEGSPYAPNYAASLFTGKGSFQKNLDLLNQRINTIHKELSYWDLYKLTHTITTPQSFPSVISGLAVGNAAVINCETFTYGNDKYHRGDVIVKISDNDEILIKALNTGVYKPISVSGEDGNYTINFEFEPAPVEGEIATAPGLTIATSGNAIYGQNFIFEGVEIATQTFPIEFFDDKPIKPIVKTFVLTEQNYEEIVLDYDDLMISTAGSDWNIVAQTGRPNVKIYVQVK